MISNAAKRRLKHLSKLKDNWDSYGAKAVSPIAVKSAEQVLDRLSIFPRVDGGIILDFSYDGEDEGDLVLEISPEGELSEMA